MNPALIPQRGVLFHLTPTNAPDEFWVNLDTRNAGTCVGRIMLRHDGNWRVYVGRTQETAGDAPDAETGMWMCIRAHLNDPGSGIPERSAGLTR